MPEGQGVPVFDESLGALAKFVSRLPRENRPRPGVVLVRLHHVRCCLALSRGSAGLRCAAAVNILPGGPPRIVVL